MVEYLVRKIDENVECLFIECPKFKTSSITFNMCIPLDEEKTSAYALIPGILEHSCAKYPNFIEFNKKLEELYGADVNSNIYKLGDYQILSVSFESLEQKFMFDAENKVDEFINLFFEVIFRPNFSNNLFLSEAVELEKRQLIEHIESEINDKRLWALKGCEKLIYINQKASLSKYGNSEIIKSLSLEKITQSYFDVINDSYIKVVLMNNSIENYNVLCKKLEKELLNFNRNKLKFEFSNSVPSIDDFDKKVEVAKKIEVMNVEQAKLVMGFSTGQAYPKMIAGMKLCVAILGGTPTSLLFKNVREKLNLCYYCSAKYNKYKGTIFIESGVEHKNLKLAEEQILAQIELMKKGEIDDEEIINAKKFMTQIYKNINDSIYELDSWFVFENFHEYITPSNFAEYINKVTKEEIIDCAKLIKLNSLYILDSER